MKRRGRPSGATSSPGGDLKRVNPNVVNGGRKRSNMALVAGDTGNKTAKSSDMEVEDWEKELCKDVAEADSTQPRQAP